LGLPHVTVTRKQESASVNLFSRFYPHSETSLSATVYNKLRSHPDMQLKQDVQHTNVFFFKLLPCRWLDWLPCQSGRRHQQQ